MPVHDPYAGVDWSRGLRGNLHAHSTQSDGEAAPAAVAAAYAALGHDFLMLSDHDHHTTAAMHAAWPAGGLILVPGCEITREGSHVLQIGGSRAAAPVADRQAVIDAIVADGGLAVMNHPNWYPEHDHISQEALVALRGYAGIEIYNGVINRHPGSAYALDRWDRLLSRGRQVWGFANDDAHRLDEIGLGWNVVFPRAPGAQGIIDALREGRFYASTGLAIAELAVGDGRVRIACPEADRIVAVGEWGLRLATADGPRLELALPAKGYVRFECWGRGERFAWSQAIRAA
jgi:hypothetical protein